MVYAKLLCLGTIIALLLLCLRIMKNLKDHFLQCHAILNQLIVRALAEDTRVSSLYSSAPLGHVRIYCTCTQSLDVYYINL